jgi:hypothetical protein
MEEATNVMIDKPQTAYAMMAVSTKATGIATLAGTRNPTNITPATKMGRRARKARVVSDIKFS